MSNNWSRWRVFPTPKQNGILVAPFGAGCYELRLGHEKILVGSGKNVALRMTSLLPDTDGGAGSRRNNEKRAYVAKQLGQIQYRTIAFTDIVSAKRFEANELKTIHYRFPT